MIGPAAAIDGLGGDHRMKSFVAKSFPQSNSVSRHSVAWRDFKLNAPFIVATINPWSISLARLREIVALLTRNSAAPSRTE